METFPDPAAFDRAAAASDLGFTRGEHPERGEQEWTSRHGQIILRQAQRRDADARRDQREGRGARRRWLARCDFWVAIEEQLPSGRADRRDRPAIDRRPRPGGGGDRRLFVGPRHDGGTVR